MDNLILFGIIAVILGGGFAYTKYKNHQIDSYRKQNRELARDKADAEMAAKKAEDEGRAKDAAMDLRERVYQAAMKRKDNAGGSDTPLSKEDRDAAKAVMDNHSTDTD